MALAARMRQKQWQVHPADEHTAEFADSLKVPQLIAQVLINRGVTDAETAQVFLNPKLTELIGPEQMPGVKQAVARIKLAIENKEKITIYGDYDVDGITSVSILWQLFTILGADIDYYIPHRVEEGYGLNSEAVEELARAGTRVLITVDCGVTAIDSAKAAAVAGIDLIITDHHQLGRQLPQAVAIVHPLLDETYGNHNSAGAMVAFKFAWAIANDFNNGRKLSGQLRDFMITATSLAAMGTIADVMDLRGENRVLTNYGLKSLPKCGLCGIDALIESTGLTGQGLDSYHIGFRLAPMLNAAGRMGHARLAVELLTSDSNIRSMQIADYLKEQNNQRRSCERKIFKQACEMIMAQGLNHPDRKSIVLANEGWHTGVIGIVASRIIDKYYRPTIMINTEEKFAQGSARSIPGFDIHAAIEACSEHLERFGGHKMAAGVRLETGKIESFAADFEAYAKENILQENVVAKLDIDAMAELGEFNYDTVSRLQMLEPFGQGNPEPVFATKGVRLVSPPRKVGAKGDHLQLTVTDNTATIRCIGFGMGKFEKKLLGADFFSIAYQPGLNTFNGNTNVQLVLKDIQFD
ncbi:single-stranded-DNA-specific exonuclease RecJ [Planctomycetota bacterium]